MYFEPAPSEQYVAEEHRNSSVVAPVVGSSSSPSGGLACAIAALAECQQMGGETSSSYRGDVSAYNMLRGCTDCESENFPAVGSSIEVSPDIQMPMARGDREWVDDRSDVADIGTSYAGSDDVAQTGLPPQDESGNFHPSTGPIVPESFEEQIMLAMAVSLAEARARTSSPGAAWH